MEFERVLLAPGVTVQVVAAVRRTAPAQEIAGLRGPLAAAFPEALSVGVLKQCDDQTLVAMAAAADAVLQSGLGVEELRLWGVIAFPRVPGRKRFQEAVAKFRTHGAWSVTPHFIPHCMLHSLSGLLSQALRLNGPNIGVGGEVGDEGEGDDASWTAAAWLAGGDAPGAWIVWTQWDRETLTDGEGTCEALIVGVVPTLETATTLEPARVAFERMAREGTQR